MPNAAAANLASQMMSDPEVALDTHAREELGLNMQELGSPWGAAGSSFVSFMIGAIVPVLPYMLLSRSSAFMTSLVLSAFALLAVGAMISSYTGRSVLISALRMLLIGFGAAAITFLVGSAIGVSTGL
jgi:VIT1/CCC1 family predicted Fe2+/Mn2+ transporter